MDQESIYFTDTRNLFLVEEEELAKFKNDRSLLMMYKGSDLDSFWVRVSRIHLNIANKALKILLQFSTTHICEQFFSTMTYLKSVKRGSLKMLDDQMRLFLSYIQQNIKTLRSSRQVQVSSLSFELRFSCQMLFLVSKVKSYLCLLKTCREYICV